MTGSRDDHSSANRTAHGTRTRAEVEGDLSVALESARQNLADLTPEERQWRFIEHCLRGLTTDTDLVRELQDEGTCKRIGMVKCKDKASAEALIAAVKADWAKRFRASDDHDVLMAQIQEGFFDTYRMAKDLRKPAQMEKVLKDILALRGIRIDGGGNVNILNLTGGVAGADTSGIPDHQKWDTIHRVSDARREAEAAGLLEPGEVVEGEVVEKEGEKDG